MRDISFQGILSWYTIASLKTRFRKENLDECIRETMIGARITPTSTDIKKKIAFCYGDYRKWEITNEGYCFEECPSIICICRFWKQRQPNDL